MGPVRSTMCKVEFRINVVELFAKTIESFFELIAPESLHEGLEGNFLDGLAFLRD